MAVKLAVKPGSALTTLASASEHVLPIERAAKHTKGWL
jgi:hypothetical protein